ncbi:hypothetical protein CK500_00340 [Halorubrum salipaludis]|uniref:Uncharacterized protein n=1 Tax=Halorubrum salipaludis TaxID=2032630 RepID=A0A2A2FKG2_9EURY|nr:hypothetical protein [Halorubrum salipaludis]PAU85157.1 hypothetical protein CK500_00340 [Halorubrum salipaludis]
MNKLGRQALVDGVQQELVTYLRNGTVNDRAVARWLDITDLNIENLDRLKRIHFCLSDDVVEFAAQLQERLRRVKTANQREREITRGEVRGAVDWPATTRLRYADQSGDRTKFACKTPYTEYNIDQNLVLKKLLWTIHSTVDEDIAAIEYDWRTDAWSDEQIAAFDRTYGRNVHLSRIRNGADIRVTPRMLNTARRSRQALYTDAFTLYDRYQRLLTGAYEDPDISELLSDTLVVPERLPRLFELFCVFRLLRGLRSQAFQLQPIETGSSQLAVLQDENHTVNVYHDRSGSLSFHVPLSELDGIEADYAKRVRNAQNQHQQLTKAFLDNSTEPSLFHGRPDLVIEVYDGEAKGTPGAIVLGEIKYSDRQQTFTRGLEELLKYMEFVQKADCGYLSERDTEMLGLLITDAVEVNDASPAGGQVTHISAQDLLTGNTPTGWIPEAVR